ncbi:hypothetical protein PMSD_17180 [Paenibacillus macquariensis subsp. defensor]|nr:hypothetical protein PMSD_17180 [Paenibacillus macquariensis subsp. defensor]
MYSKQKSKRVILVCLILGLTSGALVPHTYAAKETIIKGASSKTNNYVVTFKDLGIEKLVRTSVNKMTGSIYISDLNQITNLTTYSDMGIKSLDDLNQLSNLKYLAIYNNPITDLSSLLKLKGLEDLGFDSIPAKDFSLIGKMTWLKSLTLSQCDLTDISFVHSLKNLKILNVMNNKIEDLAPLASLSQLVFLQASYNEISDLTPIRSLNLEELHLSNNKIENIKPIEGMKNLHSLQLEYNLIKDLTPLMGKTLYMLALNSNQITDVSPLKGMTSLYSLRLEDNQIKDISMLADFKILVELTLNDNPIESYFPVATMTARLKMKDFTMTDKDLSMSVHFPDDGLEKSIRLALKQPTGEITLQSLASILEIDASNSSIKDLQGIEYLTQLISADLSGNQIKDLTPLKNLVQLDKLKLKGNLVNSYDVIRDVIRDLGEKDFNPAFKDKEILTVHTYEELVAAIENTSDDLDKWKKIKIAAKNLQNVTTVSLAHFNLYLKYRDTYGIYKYVSPSEASFKKISFSYYPEETDVYSTILAKTSVEKTSIKINARQFEQPIVEDNIKATTEIQSDNREILDIAKQITSGKLGEMDKLLAIHDWVATNIQYDYDTYGGTKNGLQDAVSVLRDKKGICSGYSNLTAALGRAAGIPTQYVTGHIARPWSTWDVVEKNMFDKNYYHAWNQAYVDGKWITLDTTWDAISYEDGKKVSDMKREYFNPDPTIFASSHTIYIPSPTPTGLNEYYFKLNDKDRELIWKLSEKERIKLLRASGFSFYSPVGHIKNGKVYALNSYRDTSTGKNFVITYNRDQNGLWSVMDVSQKDVFLMPTGSFALSKY